MYNYVKRPLDCSSCIPFNAHLRVDTSIDQFLKDSGTLNVSSVSKVSQFSKSTKDHGKRYGKKSTHSPILFQDTKESKARHHIHGDKTS